MDTNKAILNYVNLRDKGKHKREIGHYYCSEIYSIIKGYLKPEDFFTEKQIYMYSCENISSGFAYENYLQKVLEFNKADCKYQERTEIKIDDFSITVKPDFLFPNMLWETKCPDKPMADEIPDKWKYQLEAEYQAFKKPTYLGIFRKHPILTLIEYKQSDRVWKFAVSKVAEFHKKLKELSIKQNGNSNPK